MQSAPTTPRLIDRLCLTERRQFILLMLVLSFLLVANVSTRWQVSSDSGVYLALGKSLANGMGYNIAGVPQASVPPGYPLILAAAFRAGFVEPIWLNLLSCCCGVSVCGVTYLLIKEISDHRTALLTTLCIGTSWQFFRQVSMVLSDVPFMLLVLSGLLLICRGLRTGSCWLEAGGSLLIASCSIRLIGFPLATAAAVGILLQSRRVGRPRAIINVAVIAVALSGTWFCFQAQYRRAKAASTTPVYAKHIEGVMKRSTGEQFLHPALNLAQSGRPLVELIVGQWVYKKTSAWADSTPRLNLIGLIAMGLPICGGLLVLCRKGEWLIPLAVTGYVTGLAINGPLITRYLIPIAPLLVMSFFICLEAFQGRSASRSGLPRSIAWAFAALLVLLNLPDDLHRARHTRTGQRFAHQQVHDALPDLAAELDRLADDGQLFVGDESRIITFFAETPPLPDARRRLTAPPDWLSNLPETLEANGSELVVLLNDEFEDAIPTDSYARKLRRQVRNSERFAPLIQKEVYTIYKLKCTAAPGPDSKDPVKLTSKSMKNPADASVATSRF